MYFTRLRIIKQWIRYPHSKRFKLRKFKKILVLLLTLCFIKTNVTKLHGSSNKINGFKSEIMLHPVDAFTAYTLKKGEWIYNQAFTPYPSWFWWGIADNITTELDAECWLGGVVSFNFRFKLLNQKKLFPTIAFETMYQYLPREIDQLDAYDSLSVKRKGNLWYNRLNLSWKIKSNFYLNVSGGATYLGNLTIDNADTVNYTGETYKNRVTPDISAGVDFRAFEWLSLHAAASYGTTFIYLDNVPRKQQFNVGARFAPFYGHKNGMLRNFRMELAILTFRFKEVDHIVNGPLGFIYWQWGGENE